MTKIPDLANPMTGERFEFVSSSKGGEGRFRFRWTLAPKKVGPPEHRHGQEHESFTVRSGRLVVFVDGKRHDLTEGASLTVPPGTWHRFWNPGSVPVVVDVELDGAGLEDTLVPVAVHLAGKENPTPLEGLRIVVHDLAVNASRRRSLLVRALFGTMAVIGRVLGMRTFPGVGAW